MTDERMGAALWAALLRLPRGGGVVFRHHATPVAARRRLFARLMRIARPRGLTVVCAAPLAGPGAAGLHNARRRHPGLNTASVHDRREAVAALRRGADLLFVSPVFATRSHPGVVALGPQGAARLGRGIPVPIVALGGMNVRRFAQIAKQGFHGWAAIDAWRAPGGGRPNAAGRNGRPAGRARA